MCNYIVIFIAIAFTVIITSDLQPSTAISNQSPGKSFLNKLSLISSQYNHGYKHICNYITV